MAKVLKWSERVAKWHVKFHEMKPGEALDIWKTAKKESPLFIELCKEFINQGNHDFEFSNDYKYFKRIEKYNF